MEERSTNSIALSSAPCFPSTNGSSQTAPCAFESSGPSSPESVCDTYDNLSQHSYSSHVLQPIHSQFKSSATNVVFEVHSTSVFHLWKCKWKKTNSRLGTPSSLDKETNPYSRNQSLLRGALVKLKVH